MAHSSPKPVTLSEDDLLDKFRHTLDPEVMGTLYKPYMYLVYGLCMKYLKNREDSQDAVMHIFEVVLKDVPRFEIRNFKGWLYSVSRNYCLMKLRKEKGENARIEEFSRVSMESTAAMHPIEDTGDEMLQEMLKQCMEKLKEEQRRCVELFYYQQHCYKEISTLLQIGESLVKSHIQNGKRNLKVCIESKPVARNAET
jgi:RNA polymerase sigma-70 factor (ECF subfamily)